MRPAVWLVAAVLAVGSFPVDAGAISRRKECRQACGAAIEVCVAAGGKRKRCKRQTLKLCRQQGPAVCAAATTTTTDGGGGSTSTTTTPGGGGTTTTLGGDAVHGCTPQIAIDSTSPTADRTTTFGPPQQYSPKCRRIAVGQTVTFVGQFGSHPLVGGEIVGGTETPDPASPISTATDVGPSQKAATFPDAGVFPFYCDVHGASSGMVGVVFVE